MARGARTETKPPRPVRENREEAGTASSILSAAPPPLASPRPQIPRPFAPQPGWGAPRQEEKEEGEREEEEEVVWLSLGIRLGGRQDWLRSTRADSAPRVGRSWAEAQLVPQRPPGVRAASASSGSEPSRSPRVNTPRRGHSHPR